MHIGILTFHWATNYGAVIQCYALQTALERLGHRVEIINYQPSGQRYGLYYFLRFRRFLDVEKYSNDLRKEQNLSAFRKKHLKLTSDFRRQNDLPKRLTFDCVISGSDQVLNPSFFSSGEFGGATVYYLAQWPENTRRVMYAVSFGTTKYPEKLVRKAVPLMEKVDRISVREQSGRQIVCEMQRNDAVVVPDPTLLLESSDYERLVSRSTVPDGEYIFAYMLRKKDSWYRENRIASHTGLPVAFLTTEGIEEWLSHIRYAEVVVTNSFHCAVFSILFHKPFCILVEQTGNVGMNDRFYTLLSKCGLLHTLHAEGDIHSVRIDPDGFDWDYVDRQLESLRAEGIDFLKSIQE